MGAADYEQADWEDEHARLFQEKEVLKVLESRRKEQGGAKPKIIELDYEPSPEEIEYMIKNNPEVNKKALEFVADATLR